MNEPVYLGLLIESFVLNINTDDIFKDIAENIETRFDTSNYELHRSLPKENTKS